MHARYGIWAGYSRDAMHLVQWFDCSLADLAAIQQRPELLNPDPAQRNCNWYIPAFDNPFFGGIMTILRIAAYLQDVTGMEQRFIVCDPADPGRINDLITRAHPSLHRAKVIIFDRQSAFADVPAADYSVATLWTTAYVLLKVRNAARKFYLIQDFEPLFYPAGSTYAQTELTYRFNFYGIANTIEMKRFYENQYGGVAHALTPQIDGDIFYPPQKPRPPLPVRVFWYARPSNPRNGFELAANALRVLKARLGNAVEIVCAGSDWAPGDFGLDNVVQVLGLLSFEETAHLYRSCHISLAMQMSRHPSYLPLEVMACGCLLVVNANPSTAWLLEHERNCLIAPASVSAIAQTLERAVREYDKLKSLRDNGLADAKLRSSWAAELAAVAKFMSNPRG